VRTSQRFKDSQNAWERSFPHAECIAAVYSKKCSAHRKWGKPAAAIALSALALIATPRTAEAAAVPCENLVGLKLEATVISRRAWYRLGRLRCRDSAPHVDRSAAFCRVSAASGRRRTPISASSLVARGQLERPVRGHWQRRTWGMIGYQEMTEALRGRLRYGFHGYRPQRNSGDG